MFHTRTHLHPDVATTAALLGDASRGGSWLLSIDIGAGSCASRVACG